MIIFTFSLEIDYIIYRYACFHVYPFSVTSMIISQNVNDILFVFYSSHIVRETNKNADMKRRGAVNKNKWWDVSEGEMRRYIGLTFLMGIVRKPSTSMYWSLDILTQTSVFQTLMPRDRYMNILRYFIIFLTVFFNFEIIKYLFVYCLAFVTDLIPNFWSGQGQYKDIKTQILLI